MIAATRETKVGKKRECKNETFSIGSCKRLGKQEDASSAADMHSFRARDQICDTNTDQSLWHAESANE